MLRARGYDLQVSAWSAFFDEQLNVFWRALNQAIDALSD
jgi:hypothetical protein